jgi:hypothetical protein
VQLEDENVEEFENTLIRIICGHSFADDGNEEEMTVQLEFVSAIRCHDPCAMEMLNHGVAKLRSY